jgi:aminoglycoside 2'-N-acetyltransferase I
MMDTHIEVFPEAQVPLPLRLQMVGLQDQAWPSERPSPPSPWHDDALSPVSMLLVGDGRVVAALDILSKELEHAGERWAASGLSAVVTDPAERGRGYGGRLVAAARARIAASAVDVGLFTCDPALGRFYERAGWDLLPDTTIVGGTPEDPLSSDALGKITFGGFFSERARARRDGFVGTRILLYPGVIDRLW